MATEIVIRVSCEGVCGKQVESKYSPEVLLISEVTEAAIEDTEYRFRKEASANLISSPEKNLLVCKDCQDLFNSFCVETNKDSTPSSFKDWKAACKKFGS